jgi:hypothetical protein
MTNEKVQPLTDEERRAARLVRNGYWIDRLLAVQDSLVARLAEAEKRVRFLESKQKFFT